ncbi:MAG: NADH-quinone oxidoreductase subunit L [Caldimicrobium sp.]|nr:NADH-quinone oxidoreductase subunit L [Caldimicrobium sp.]MCX7874265.1 NADH-quinone oxidoreductase subunit L [Caldimicrobium sp.]MDW8093928.1 NADH-quinone oxidoreductase subunit L [Caldimicrobium sp.]
MVGQSLEIVRTFDLSAVLVPLLPLVASALTLILGRKYFPQRPYILPVVSLFLSFLLSLKLLIEVLSGRIYEFDLYTWFVAGSLKVGFGFLIDPLSVMMLCMVTSLSLLIHIYSIGYMEGDPGYYRFFAYISLFTFFMLVLVSSNNLVQLYLGWEGVGLCSYLLIGFWYEKKSASDAAKKAFIINRVGDFGFALGIFAVFYYLGTIYYHEIFQRLPQIANSYVGIGDLEIHLPFLLAFLLFCGAMGKSAQVPLHTWLPDAMEGPTPVSALIHAATMVTAGVFMVARLHALFELSPYAMAMVALVGLITCFMAATIAPTQFDIKRVIAYSTLSQLGYMFMACGVGAFAIGMFHLFTHAYFKALLFLGAGSIIHALHHAPDPNDIRIMGGLRKFMPITFWTFLVASLSISGIPGLAGFFSKDEILVYAFFSKYPWGKLVWFVGLVVASLTAFYTFRIFFKAFWGEFRGLEALHGHLPKESPKVMTIPLIILSFGAIFSGWLGIPEALGGGAQFQRFLESVLGHPELQPVDHKVEYGLMVLSVLAGLSGIGLAYLVYVQKPALETLFSSKLCKLYTFLYRKWYFDELYHRIFVIPTLWLARTVVNLVMDAFIIDYTVNGSAHTTHAMAGLFRRFHAGLINYYNWFILIGIILYLIFINFK